MRTGRPHLHHMTHAGRYVTHWAVLGDAIVPHSTGRWLNDKSDRWDNAISVRCPAQYIL